MHHDDDEDIPALMLNETIKNQPENIVDEEFIELDYHSMDEVYAIRIVPNHNDAASIPIEFDEFVCGQIHDRFCTKIQRRTKEGKLLPFEIDNGGLLT